MARVISVPEMFFMNGCLDNQDVRRPSVYSSDSSPLAQLWDGSETTDVEEGPDGNETCRLQESPVGSHIQSWTISFIKTYIVSGICVFGIFGNLLTFLVLSKKRLEVIIIFVCDSPSVNDCAYTCTVLR